MCNAWNHSPSCTCGWGGDGHIGKRSSGPSRGGYIAFPGIPRIINTFESYVNPNASCPECGASVFFYQSENGGRVFFDELGPPWPRHPCTSQKSIPAPIKEKLIKDKHLANVLKYQWLKAGWKPFAVDGFRYHGNSCTHLAGVLEGKRFGVYVGCHLEIHIEDILVHIKQRSETGYECSIYNGVRAVNLNGDLFASSLVVPSISSKKKRKKNKRKRKKPT